MIGYARAQIYYHIKESNAFKKFHLKVAFRDNTLSILGITLPIPGDVDGDRDVDIYDIVRLVGVYGISKPDPHYDHNCDIDGDGDIDIYDIVIAAGHYMQSWPP